MEFDILILNFLSFGFCYLSFLICRHRLVVRTPGFSAKGGSASGGHPVVINMYYLYILKSLKDNGYYIGITDNLEKRLNEHNQGKTKSLRHRLPVEFKYKEDYVSKTDARKRELFLKRNYQMRKQLLLKIGFDIK